MASLLNRLLFLGVFVLSSACSSSGHWKHAHLNTGTEFSSSKLCYMFPEGRGIQLEVFRSQKDYRGYLSVESHPLLPSSSDSKKSQVCLNIQKESFSFLADLHEGSHRLLLPKEALEKILLALSQNLEVTVETSGYKTRLSPEGFSKAFAKFQNPSRFPKLIQLPL